MSPHRGVSVSFSPYCSTTRRVPLPENGGFRTISSRAFPRHIGWRTRPPGCRTTRIKKTLTLLCGGTHNSVEVYFEFKYRVLLNLQELIRRLFPRQRSEDRNDGGFHGVRRAAAAKRDSLRRAFSAEVGHRVKYHRILRPLRRSHNLPHIGPCFSFSAIAPSPPPEARSSELCAGMRGRGVYFLPHCPSGYGAETFSLSPPRAGSQ